MTGGGVPGNPGNPPSLRACSAALCTHTVKQFYRANTLDFYVHALQSTYRVAHEPTYYESLASARYVEEANFARSENAAYLLYSV